MNDFPQDDVTRPQTGERFEAPSTPQQRVSRMMSGAHWIMVMAIGAGTLIPIANATANHFSNYLLVQSSDASISAKLASSTFATANADDLEALSELALIVEPENVARSLDLARKAVEKQSDRPFVWARIAWLESQIAGAPNPAAVEALRKSMDLCPLCDQELIRWRFNFVLGHWKTMPDDIRRRAFEQADILRWRGSNAEFLAEMRVKATQAGIPYDELRAAVNTPVRSWELGPAPQTASAS